MFESSGFYERNKKWVEAILGERIEQQSEWNKVYLLGVKGRGKINI